MANISISPSVHHPSMTLNPSFGGCLGYVSMGLLAGVIFPVWGHVEVSNQIIQGIWNHQQLKIVSNQIEIEKQKLKNAEDKAGEYSIKIDRLLSGRSNQELSNKIATAEEAIQEHLFNLERLKEEEVNLKIAIEDNKQKFIAAVFALIPFLGVLGVGIYLKAKASDVQDNGVHGCAEALAQHAVQGYETLIQAMFYPLRDKNSPLRIRFESCMMDFGRQQFEGIKAEEIEIPVNRGHYEGKISAYLVSNEETHSFDPHKPVMVFFHGNGQTKETAFHYVEFYKGMGFNVIAVTIGGYPGSEEGVLTSEISSYQDANAVICYLKEQGFKEIGIHGLSIGGTLAFAAAELHPDVVKFVVADQTLGRAKDVGANLMRNVSEGMLPEALIRGGVGGAFQTGIAVPGVLDSKGEPYVTDGLNNIRKVNILRKRAENGEADCHVFAFKAKQDDLMGRIKGDDGYKESFSDDIIMARYRNLDDHLVELYGGHGSLFIYSSEINEFLDELEAVFFSKEKAMSYEPQDKVI